MYGGVFGDGKLLMVPGSSDCRWALPSGWADIGDSPSRAIEREIFEESGYTTRATRLLAVHNRASPRHGHPPALHHYKLFFRCEITGGQPTSSYKTTAVNFFGPDAIPPLSAGRNSLSQIQRLFDFWQSPDQPTDFD
ncbi:MAG: NUDIX domain-containing protein [Nodosilinea sp.]